MSRYPITNERYSLIVGYDPPLQSLFAQVWARGKESGEAPPQVWLGASGQPLLTLEALLEPLRAYGDIPLEIQVALLRDLDADRPLPFSELSRALVTLCLQAPSAHLPEEGHQSATTPLYVALDASGWHLHAWDFATAAEAETAFSHIVYGEEENAAQRLPRTEAVTGYVSDSSVVLRVHEAGFTNRLPAYAGVRRANGGAGALLSGPVVIAGEYRGLTGEQVRQIVEQEVFFVPSEIRKEVTELWYRGWTRLYSRQASILRESGSTRR